MVLYAVGSPLSLRQAVQTLLDIQCKRFRKGISGSARRVSHQGVPAPRKWDTTSRFGSAVSGGDLDCRNKSSGVDGLPRLCKEFEARRSLDDLLASTGRRSPQVFGTYRAHLAQCSHEVSTRSLGEGGVSTVES